MSGRIISGGEVLDDESYIKHSTTACRMPKSGGDRNMAKERKEWSDENKIDHYKKRVNNMSLSQGQRNYAAQRLTKLTGSPVVAAQASAQQNRNSATPQQRGNNYPRNVRNGNNINVFVHHVK